MKIETVIEYMNELLAYGFTDDGECVDCFDKRMNAHADAEARLIFNISDGR